MKKLLALFVALLCFGVGLLDAKDVKVKGHTRKDGTYVAPYTRTSPNKTKNDNYSTMGNVNPYTGKVGTRPRDEAATKILPSPVKSNEASATVAPGPKIVGWLAVKSGMSETELRLQLGSPKEVEAKGEIELWIYPTGHVFVKQGRVLAWKKADGY